MRYDLLVFDWDGTLMDSAARIVSCLQAAAADVHMTPPEDGAAREVIGLGLAEAMARLFPGQPPQIQQRLVERYREHFLVLNPAPSSLFSGVRETLAELHAAGFFLAVATGKSRRGLDRELEESGLGAFFHTTRCADETFSKPHPRMLLEVIESLGADASQTLMIGDSEYDMQMAVNARTAALGVAYGVHAPQRLLSAGARDILNRIDELTAWLSAETAA